MIIIIEILFAVHVSVILEPKSTGELKTKPMQNSIRNLRASGLIPDLLVCRSERPLNKALREKIAAFGMVELEQVKLFWFILQNYCIVIKNKLKYVNNFVSGNWCARRSEYLPSAASAS